MNRLGWTNTALLLAFLAAVLTIEPCCVRGQNAREATSEKAASFEAAKLKLGKHETAIYVGKMHCKTCARKIAGKLYAIKGVKKVSTNVKANLAIVTSEPKKPLDPVAAWGAVQKAGFKPTKLIGASGTYVPHKDAKNKTPVKLAEKPAKKVAVAR